jgi:hypothetical protein
MDARTGGELPASGGITLDCRGYLFEAKTQYVVKQEGCAFEWGEAQHQRQGDIRLLFVFLDDRVGKPGTDIGLPLMARRLELVEAEPRHGALQESRSLAHLAAVGLHPPDEGLLHNILGVGDRA